MRLFSRSKPFDDGVIVIDVRERSEYRQSHLEGAVHMDLTSSRFAARAAKLDKDAHYVVYCKSGRRAAQACTILRQLGCEVVINAGGMVAAQIKTGRSIIE
jgi:phage shock protein E